jgi:hypothetical protein
VQFDPNLGESLIHAPVGQLEWTAPAVPRVPAEGDVSAEARGAAVANASAVTDQGKFERTRHSSSTSQSKRPRLAIRPVSLAELDVYRNIAANAPCADSSTSFSRRPGG